MRNSKNITKQSIKTKTKNHNHQKRNDGTSKKTKSWEIN